MTYREILSRVDHTLLKQGATWEQIKAVCDDGLRFGTASVCIPPSFVKQAAEYLKGRLPVCTVIGFPNGYSTPEVKVFETEDAIRNGADEIDMVINIGELKAGNDDVVRADIAAVAEAAHAGGAHLKVIIECCLLTEEEKVRASRLTVEGGADFVKTSTGFSTGGATVEDVRLMRETVGPDFGVKAAGGIRTLADAEAMIEAGANRLGVSASIAILSELDA